MRDAHPPPDSHRILIGNFPNGVLVLFDTDLYYRIIGPETLPFSGRHAVDMIDKHFYELFPEETGAELEPRLNVTIYEKLQSFDIDYDGRIHHVETKPTQIEGDPYGILVTQGVTDVRQTSEEFEQYRETGDDASLDGIENALERIEDLIVDLTALARSSMSSANYEPVSLAAVARDV